MVHNKHDTWVRAVLMNKREASIFLNLALKLKVTNEIKPEILETQDNRFITKSFYNKETDIIYKLKGKNVYVLIEHQSSVDKHMAKRIIEYIVEIIRKDEKEQKIKSSKYKLPLVIPIVLYTGKEKWSAKKSIVEIQEKLPGYENNGFGNYIVVDANKYSEEKLLNSNGILAKIILLDKIKDKKETEGIYNKIDANKLTKNEKEILNEYLCNISSDIINKENFSKLRKKYKIEEGEEQMLVETLSREIEIESKKKAKKIAPPGQEQLVAAEIASEMAEELAYSFMKMLLKNNTVEDVKRAMQKQIDKLEEERLEIRKEIDKILDKEIEKAVKKLKSENKI